MDRNRNNKVIDFDEHRQRTSRPNVSRSNYTNSDRNHKGRVNYSHKNCSRKNIKFRRVKAFAGTMIIFFTGVAVGHNLPKEEVVDNPTIGGYSDEYGPEALPIIIDGMDYNNEEVINNFKQDNVYNAGDEINVKDCDFSNISVVLDAADSSETLYSDLYSTKQEFENLGIDCVVTSYYDSAIDEIERIKNETGNTVYVATVQNGQNKWQEHFVMTNYYNNEDALGGSIEKGDPNSSDVFALAVRNSLPSGTRLKKGLQEELTTYDRRPSELESQINKRNLSGVKAITIRPSEIDPLRTEELTSALVNGVVKASTLNNDQTYFVRAGADQVYKDAQGNTRNYSVASSIKNRYPNAPQPEKAFGEDSFYSDAAILTREVPVQLTNAVSINYGKIKQY